MATRVNSENLQRVLQRRLIARIRRLEPGSKSLNRVLREIGFQIENQTKLNIRRGGTGPNKKQGGLIDTGALINSVFHEVIGRGDVSELVAGSKGVVYAAIHEFGGVITPVRAKALTIPLTPEAKKKRARDFVGTFIIQTDSGQAFIARQVGDNIERLYMLRQSVTIPARPYLRPAFKKVVPKFMDKLRKILKRPIRIR